MARTPDSDRAKPSTAPPAADGSGRETEEHRPGGRPAVSVRRFKLSVVDGAAAPPWESSGDRCSVGSHPSNDLCIDDATVSRFHCEIVSGEDGVTVRDLGSRNGTFVDGVLVREAFLKSGSLLQVGRAGLRFQLAAEKNARPVSTRTSFGSLVGTSIAMRSVFAFLETVAPTDVTVLLGGETGTGKGAVAESLHAESPRRKGPFVVVDCSAISANLLESELFGHEKGAFTGAEGRRLGAFEAANGGTLFLDEVGELPLDLQPKLLRALEERMVRRLGSNRYEHVDVRLVAATHRDLRHEVNEKRFRADLYYRIAVARITLPPLRERAGDIPILVQRMLQQKGVSPEQARAVLDGGVLARLAQHAWPGNVRELRNHVDRLLVFQDADAHDESLSGELSGGGGAQPIDLSVPLAEARKRAADDLERRYLVALMAACEDRTVQAAAIAGVDRVHLYRLLRRHGLR